MNHSRTSLPAFVGSVAIGPSRKLRYGPPDRHYEVCRLKEGLNSGRCIKQPPPLLLEDQSQGASSAHFDVNSMLRLIFSLILVTLVPWFAAYRDDPRVDERRDRAFRCCPPYPIATAAKKSGATTSLLTSNLSSDPQHIHPFTSPSSHPLLSIHLQVHFPAPRCSLYFPASLAN